jgi:hypothetical protein
MNNLEIISYRYNKYHNFVFESTFKPIRNNQANLKGGEYAATMNSSRSLVIISYMIGIEIYTSENFSTLPLDVSNLPILNNKGCRLLQI